MSLASITVTRTGRMRPPSTRLATTMMNMSGGTVAIEEDCERA